MKLSAPIGNSIYAPLFVRIPVGAYLLFTGWQKLESIQTLVGEVKALNMMPPSFATLYGTLLPFLYVAAGFCLVVGLWTTLAGIVAGLSLFTYMWIFRLLPFSELKAGGEAFKVASSFFTKEMIMLGAIVSLLYSGAGAYSVDSFRKNEGGGGGGKH